MVNPVGGEQKEQGFEISTPITKKELAITQTNQKAAAVGQLAKGSGRIEPGNIEAGISLKDRKFGPARGWKLILFGSLMLRKALSKFMPKEENIKDVTGNQIAKEYPLGTPLTGPRLIAENQVGDVKNYANKMLKQLWKDAGNEYSSDAPKKDRLIGERLIDVGEVGSEKAKAKKVKDAKYIQIQAKDNKKTDVAVGKGERLYRWNSDTKKAEEIKLSRFPFRREGWRIIYGRVYNLEAGEKIVKVGKDEKLIAFDRASQRDPIIIKKSQQLAYEQKDKIVTTDAKEVKGITQDTKLFVIEKKNEQLVKVGEELKIAKKENFPIILIALMQEGSEKCLGKANDLILQMNAFITQPREGKKSGNVYDYTPDDFPISHMTRLLWMHAEKKEGEPKLSDVALKHLLDKLLLLQGGEFDLSAPNPLVKGIAIRETENHLLMGRGSAYLKNQFLLKNEMIASALRYDINELAEEAKKLEINLEKFIQTIIDAGPFEFNSKPYAEATIRALGNLADYAEEPIKAKATQALDTIFRLHAEESMNFHSYAQSRRRVNKDDPGALSNYLTLFCSTWQNPPKEGIEGDKSQPSNNKLVFNALYMKYRPQKKTMELMTNKGEPGSSSVVRVGHGGKSPSIFDRVYNSVSYASQRSSGGVCCSGRTLEGADFLLSAGGAAQNATQIFQNDIFSRHTCLITGDVKDILDTFYLGDSVDRPIEKIEINEEIYKRYEDKLKRIERNKDLTPDEIEERNKELDHDFLVDATLYEAQKRNNTGVYRNFACGACPVNIPKDKEPIATDPSGWSLYKANDGLYVAAYGAEPSSKLGLMVLFDIKGDVEESQAARLLGEIAKANPTKKLKTTFKFPEEFGGDTLTYDVHASEREWVMKSVNGQPLNRDFEEWPLLTKEKKEGVGLERLPFETE